MKIYLINIKQQIWEHPYLVSFMALLLAMLKFILETVAVDGALFLFLTFMIAIDTFTGTKLAKKKNTFDYKVLKDKTIGKVLGYIIFLIALWTLTMMVFIMNIKDGKPVINSYYLNIPLMTTMLFFSGVEFLSIKDNLTQMWGIKIPSSVVSKVENFIGSGGADADKLIDNQTKN